MVLVLVLVLVLVQVQVQVCESRAWMHDGDSLHIPEIGILLYWGSCEQVSSL